MLRFFSRVTTFLIICACLLIGIGGLSGRPLGGDVFLFLTQLNDSERNAVIYSFDTRTGVSQIILKQPDMLDFTLSPHGQLLLYTKREHRETAFYIYNLYDGTTKRLLSGDIDTPRWSPDGQWIAFRLIQSDESGLYIIPATGGEARRVTQKSYGVYTWSSDSSRLVYANQGVVGTNEEDWNIYSVALNGESTRFLADYDGFITGITVRGESLYAIIDYAIQSYDFNTEQWSVIAEYAGYAPSIWSPQGDRLAIMLYDFTAWGIYILSPERDLLSNVALGSFFNSSRIEWWLSG